MNNEAKLNLTAEQKTVLATLRSQRNAKFQEIAALLSQDYGGSKSGSEIADEASAAIERWTEEAEMDRKEPSAHATPTPLQRLLNQHYDFGDQIDDILDGAADPH